MIHGAMFLRAVTERYGPHVVHNATILRAMRAVFSEVLPARLAPLPSTQFSRIDYRSSKPL
jgi:hypothetical protein